MNNQQTQFNRQRVAALLFASLILVIAVVLVWARVEASGSTSQPAKMVQDCAYSPQPGQLESSTAEGDCPGADLGEGENGPRPWSHLKFVKGGRPTGGGGGDFR